MTTKTNDVYLYILMRTDMASMNPGKAVAQGAHAANMFGELMARRRESPAKGDHTIKQFAQWQDNRMFGTTITLSVNLEQLMAKVEQAITAGFVSGVCYDPTYPLRDGDYTHLIPVNTCGYVFGSKEELSSILGDLELMR
jgi:peptidyl-tRNA hydrolase